LILPKEIRERHGWGPGVELEIEDRGNSVVLRRAVDVPETTLEEVLGCTGYQGPAHSLDEMEAGIARGALRTCEGAPVVELVPSP
jgi:AbrB family looped-hinge helix DNA binding protein